MEAQGALRTPELETAPEQCRSKFPLKTFNDRSADSAWAMAALEIRKLSRRSISRSLPQMLTYVLTRSNH